MDVTQNNIKINQTNKINLSNVKSTTRGEVPSNSFDEVFAMINSGERAPESEEQSEATVLQNRLENLSGDLTFPSEEDWKELDSILASWLADIRQLQPSLAEEQQGQENGSSVNGSQPQVLSAMETLYQNSASVGRMNLDEWLHKVEGHNQSASLDDRQLIERLGQVIQDLQSQQREKSIKGSNDSEGELRMMLTNLKTAMEEGFRIPKNEQPIITGILVGKTLEHRVEPRPMVSLDKNHIMFSTKSEQGSSDELSSNFHALTSIKMEDQSNSNGLSLMGTHFPMSDGKWNGLSTAPPSPILSVSQFVPEVSEWIGGNLRISNNQFGEAEARFFLYPEHLGHMEIKISWQQGQVSAQIMTDTPLAKEMLETQLQQLRQALHQHGLQVQKLDIVQQSPVSVDQNQTNLSFSQGGSNSSREQRTFNSDQNESQKQKESDQKESAGETVSITYGSRPLMAVSSIDFTA